jgi:hypothetical protein
MKSVNVPQFQYLTNGFFNIGSFDSTATVLIHEMWHLAGGDPDSNPYDSDIVAKCKTGETVIRLGL